MENAIWNNETIMASKIAKDYEKEKAVRKASGKKELLCPDPECKNKTLRYCHGEIKAPYFAHVNNEICDYAVFDSKNSNIMKSIRATLYEHFTKIGYSVKPEVKILPHHYTHLLIETDANNKIAIEIATQHISANRIDHLTNEYRKIGIPVKWIVIGDTNHPVKENQTFFIKRYALNESKNKDLIVVNWDGKTAAQYKADADKYLYKGRELHSSNYPDTYSEIKLLTDLIIENEELTFYGFHSRYELWHDKKANAFKKKINELVKQEIEVKIRLTEQAKIRKEYQSRSTFVPNNSLWAKRKKENKDIAQDMTSASYEERQQEVLKIIDQQDTQARDSSGTRWVKCEKCGKVDTSDKFVSYGGMNHINLGVCNSCSRLSEEK